MKLSLPILYCLLVVLFTGCKSQPLAGIDSHSGSLTQISDLTLSKRKVAPNPDQPDRKNTVWLRNGVQILSQTPFSSDGFSQCMITPFDLKTGRLALVIGFTGKTISGLSSGPALSGYDFSVDDFTRDGVPDFIQIIDGKNNKVVEAYTIIRGIVEPLPEKEFKEDRSEFYYDDKLVDYIKTKIKNWA